ncbi:hypothetical protein DBP19_36665 [Streptomyces sp. CS090A]|uniref:hypothetical protein n=1 Tax=Streptomyces sp. CS090A TaxID=2162710 RepID=UPI000D510599|nr:hypothetical protein [Streptomyces sp. CS090A]PVC80387.1 hypothetical protein DBP19_36665 [Streptomyces sp. CS090A]
MGSTRTRYAHGSTCVYRMITACSGAIERPALRARSTLGRQADQVCPYSPVTALPPGSPVPQGDR